MTFQKFIEHVSHGIENRRVDERYLALASHHESSDLFANLSESIEPLIVQISKHEAAYFQTGDNSDVTKLKFYTGDNNFVFSINLTQASCKLSLSQTNQTRQSFPLLQNISHLNCATLSESNRVQIGVSNDESMADLRHYMNRDNNDKKLSDVFKKIIQKESSKVADERNKFLEKLDSEYSGEDLLKVYECFSSNLPLLVNTVASKLRFEPSRVLFKIEGTANNVAGIKLSNTVNTFEIVLKQAREEFRKNIETRLESYKVDTVIEGDWLKVTIAPESILELSKLMADWLGVPLNRSQEDQPNESESNTMSSSDIPLNQILFGPPGTGKTYHTIEAAVKAVEPAFKWQSRSELKAEYERLSGEKRIRFVTFHQSYGYEEFVEGLKAVATPDNQISYKVADGIFKSTCEAASVSELNMDSEINSSGKVWKLSIEGAHRNASKTYCLENNLAAIGWGDTGDLSIDTRNDYFHAEGKNNQNSLNYFSQDMEEGDLVVCIDSKTSVEAIGVVTGSYRYVEEGLPSRDSYNHQLPINWFAKGFSVDFKELNDNKQFNLPTCYPLSRLSVSDVLSHLKAHGVTVESEALEVTSSVNPKYALIIDEINRGNISKIFGELITLIEPSKRKGASEELSLILPYSGKLLSVPDNLHIIGTMNTADRSLAMMDTALRRRFDFKEMMPTPKLFKNRTIKGIDLTLLLETLNKRIEVLYDREHTLGHAFFFPAYNEENEEKAFTELQQAFKNKIIPLLEEYFYEDWNKIRLVLGDSLKSDPKLRFLAKQEDMYSDLFGSNHDLELYEDKKVTYSIKPFEGDETPWSKSSAYIGIYEKLVSDSSES